MTVFPVAVREMNAAARRKGTYWWRVGAGLLGVLVMAWLFLVSAAGMPLQSQGRVLFTILSGWAFAFSLLIGVVFTSDSLSEERREGTLGLLFLTDLKGYDVALGKLAASSITAAFAIFGIVPMISLTFLLGGITWEQVGMVGALVLNTIFLSLSAGIFVSALSKHERRAMFGTLLLIFLVVTTPYGLTALVNGVEDPGSWPDDFLPASAAFSYWLTLERTLTLLQKQSFWMGLGVQHAVGWVFLLCASGWLPKAAHEQPPNRFWQGIRSFIEQWSYGRGEQRRRHRARMLDRNAFSWLAARERMKGKYVWGVFAFFTGFWLWIYSGYPNMAFDLPILGSVLFLVHVILKVWVISEVASRMVEDRRSGALELLLSTPLSPREMSSGINLAVWKVFGLPIVTLIIAETFLLRLASNAWVSHTNKQELTVVLALGIGSLVLDIWALKWLAAWRSLFGKSVGKVIVACMFRVLFVPWLSFAVVGLFLGLLSVFVRINYPKNFEFYLWGGVTLFWALYFGIPARYNFLNHFREMAAARFDARQKSPRLWSTAWATMWARWRKKPTDLEAAPPKNWFRRHWFITGTAALAAGIFLGGYLRGLYWNGRVSDQLERMRTKGPVSAAELAALHPWPEQREDATPLLEVRPPWTHHFPALNNLTPGEAVPAELLKTLETQHASNRVALAKFYAITNFPKLKMVLDPLRNNWWGGPMASFWTWVPLMQAEAVLAFQKGEKERAMAALETMIHLLKLLGQYPLAQGGQMRQDGLARLRGTIEYALGGPGLSLKEVEWLEGKLAGLDDPDYLWRCVRSERAMVLSLLEMPAEELRGAIGMGVSGPERIVSLTATGLMKRSGSYAKFISAYLRQSEEMEGASRLPFPRRSRAIEEYKNMELQFGLLRLTELQHFLQPPWWIFQNEGLSQASLNLMRAALWLERELARKGEFPGKIPDLEYTRDPFSEGLLVYRPGDVEPASGGYLLYSFGLDFKDGAARTNEHPRKNFDIIFRRPAAKRAGGEEERKLDAPQ